MKVGEIVKRGLSVNLTSKGPSQMLKLPVVAAVIMSQAMAMAQSGSTSTAAGTSTTSLEAAKPKVNKFSFVLANATTNSFDKAKTEGGAGTINIMSLGYKYSSDLSLSLTLTNDYKIPGSQDKKGEYAVYRDTAISASTTHGSFLGTEKTPVKYSLLLPTSVTSRSAEVNQVFAARADITLGYDLADKLSTTTTLAPVLYVRKGPDQLRQYILSELRYSYTPAFSNYIYAEYDVRGLTKKSLEKSKEALSLGVGVGYSPNKMIDLALAVSRDRYLSVSNGENPSIKADPKSKFVFLDEREISYTAEAVLKF